MLIIKHDDINFHPMTEEKAKAARKIQGFNFIKDKAANLIMDSSITKKGNVVIHNGYPYLFFHFLDRETLRSTRILVGAFEVLINEDFGGEYQENDKLTNMWRSIMIKYGPKYKNSLIKALEERKQNVIKEYDKQIEEIEKI